MKFCLTIFSPIREPNLIILRISLLYERAIKSIEVARLS